MSLDLVICCCRKTRRVYLLTIVVEEPLEIFFIDICSATAENIFLLADKLILNIHYVISVKKFEAEKVECLLLRPGAVDIVE